MSKEQIHLGFTLKDLSLDLPIIRNGLKQEAPAAPPPPQFQDLIAKSSLQVPEPLKGAGSVKIKVNKPMLQWMYESMKAQVIIILMYGKESPEGKLAVIEINRLKKLRKAFSLFFLLKAVYDDGFNRDLMGQTAGKLKISIGTLKTRLKILFEYKLCYEQHNVIKCYSHQRARYQMGINPGPQENLYIRLIPNLKTFDYVIDAMYERDKSFSIKSSTTRKLRQNYELAEALAIVCEECGIRTDSSTVNRQHIQDAQQIAFTNSKVRRGTEWLALLYHFNVNEHPSYAHMSKLYGYRSLGGMAYRKRKWVRLGIAQIHHRQFADRTREIRPEQVKKAGHGHYSRPHKATMFHMVDKIKLLV